jgi:drug/metabolite transporter (DMT)-like permease
MSTATHLLPVRNAAGVAFLVAGVAVFSVQDLILKLLSGAYPLHQAMVLRSFTAIPFLLLLVHLDGGLRSLLTPGTRAMIWRGVVMFVAYTAYYLALAALPMATTVALYFSAPLFITILSVFFLSETVGPRRWIALMAGFAGVLIMVRPGGDLFEWAALLPVLSGFAYAISMIAARRLGSTESAAALAFWGNAVFLAAALAMSAVLGTGTFANETHPSLAFLLRGWVMPTGFDLMLMMACGVIAAAGLTLLTQAYRIGEASVVSPFEYTGLLWSVIYGWAFWHQWPTMPDWAGIAIIIGAGLYILWRERSAS